MPPTAPLRSHNSTPFRTAMVCWIPICVLFSIHVLGCSGGSNHKDPPSNTSGRSIQKKHPSRKEPEVKVVSTAFSPDGRRFAVLTDDGVYRLWYVPSGKQTKKARLQLGPKDTAQQILFNQDGDVLVLFTPSWRMWNVTANEKFRIEWGMLPLASNGKLLFSGDNLWDISTGKKVRKVNTSGLDFDHILSPDGKTLAYCITESLAQYTSIIIVVDCTTSKELLQIGDIARQIQTGYRPRRSPRFSPDGKSIAFSQYETGKQYVCTRVLSKNKGIRRRAEFDSVLGFSNDAKSLYIWHRKKGLIQELGSANLKPLRSIKIRTEVQTVILSPDGTWLALLSGDDVTFRKLVDD